jgi:hypothetical protein
MWICLLQPKRPGCRKSRGFSYYKLVEVVVVWSSPENMTQLLLDLLHCPPWSQPDLSCHSVLIFGNAENTTDGFVNSGLDATSERRIPIKIPCVSSNGTIDRTFVFAAYHHPIPQKLVWRLFEQTRHYALLLDLDLTESGSTFFAVIIHE